MDETKESTKQLGTEEEASSSSAARKKRITPQQYVHNYFPNYIVKVLKDLNI